jgi:hypothetical protein
MQMLIKVIFIFTRPLKVKLCYQNQHLYSILVHQKKSFSTPQDAKQSKEARTPLQNPSTPWPYIPFAFASKTLTASEPLFGTPFGFGMERMPFSLFDGVFPLRSSS